jgi:hypothetical protein
MKKILMGITSILGVIAGTLSLSILGLISIFAPQYSDNLHQKLIDWAENDE